MGANVLAASGFHAVRAVGSGAPNYAVQACQIAYNYGTQIGKGDPVYQLNTGYIALYAAGGTTIKGIFDGCKYYDPTQQKPVWLPYWPAPGTLTSSQTVEAYVLVDPFFAFQCQVSAASGVVQSCVGKNIDILSGSSGAPNSAGISTCSLDYTTLATTATLPFRITGIVQVGPTPTYDPTGANPWLEVVMNTADLKQVTGI